MEITGEYRIPADPESVWKALNDPEVLRASVPGCEELEKVSETEFRAKVLAKVGPVKAHFSGVVTLTDLDPPNRYTIAGEGKGTVGFAKGSAKVELIAEGGATVLRYTANANVGGKLAQVGSRLVDSTARRLADQFFGAFADRVSPEGALAAAEAAPAPEAAKEAPRPKRGVATAAWVIPLIVIVVVLLLYFSGVLSGR